MKIPNVEKRLEGKSDGSTAKEIMKLAEKDPLQHIDLEFMDNLKRNYKEAVENGFQGDIDQWLDSLDTIGLKRAVLNDGGLVDFTNLTPSVMKAIFISENGYAPRSAKELVRGVKMYMKNLDNDGIPFGTFGRKD
jgi:hypothetical protein